MANERWYYGLDNVYDLDHRARLIENGEVLLPMRMRGHNASDMPYDVRFEEYFERAGLLPFVLQFKRPPPKINSTAITALLDRWRPETHSFHLPCGEMTVTLQDFAMITGLPIDGDALTGRVENEGWRLRVTSLIGACPPAPEKETRSAGIPYTWLRDNRGGCPANAGPVVVQQYARAFLWHLLTQVVFPDASGDTASWMYLDPLRDWDANFSWGSAGLAFLYRQLDDACRRRTSGSSMGGCVWALSVWMWERLPVGRPQKLQPTEWEGLFENDDPYRLPTIAYSWDRVEGYTGRSKALHKSYTNELDTLTYKQVNWMPYESERTFPLNAMCVRDEHLWRTRCPIICFYAVEWHLPQRVAKQFGKRQRTPPEHESTGLELHAMTRQKCPKIRDWYAKHREWVAMWRKREEFVETDGTMDNEKAYLKHLEWFDDGEKYRLRLKPSWTQADCLELEEEDGDDEYDMAVRESAGSHRDYAPVYDRVGLLLNRSINEAGVALQHPPGSVESDTALRSTITRFVQRCRRMAAMLACHRGDTADARVPTQSRTTSAAASSSRAGPSHVEEDDEEEQEEQDQEEHEQEEQGGQEQEERDEIRMSQMQDAPEPSQPTQPTRRIRKPKAIHNPDGQVIRTRPARKARTLGDPSLRKRGRN